MYLCRWQHKILKLALLPVVVPRGAGKTKILETT